MRIRLSHYVVSPSSQLYDPNFLLGQERERSGVNKRYIGKETNNNVPPYSLLPQVPLSPPTPNPPTPPVFKLSFGALLPGMGPGPLPATVLLPSPGIESGGLGATNPCSDDALIPNPGGAIPVWPGIDLGAPNPGGAIPPVDSKGIGGGIEDSVSKPVMGYQQEVSYKAKFGLNKLTKEKLTRPQIRCGSLIHHSFRTRRWWGTFKSCSSARSRRRTCNCTGIARRR